MAKLVYKAKRTPDGTLLESMYNWDYNSHLDKNGKTYVIDGGLNPVSQSDGNEDAEDLCIWTSDPFEKVREFASRYEAKTGKYVKLKDMSNEWLDNTIQFYLDAPLKDVDDYILMYIQEKQFRNEEDN